MKIPCFVIHHNRPTFLRRCVEALNDEMLEVIIIDNASTDDSLNEFGRSCKLRPRIFRTDKNYGHTVLWNEEIQKQILDFYCISLAHPYIVTDCDIVVPKRLPWLDILLMGLDDEKLAKYNKFGLGLNTTRIPSWYPQRAQVKQHEEQNIYRKRINHQRFIEMPVDTTLALYRGGYNKYSIWGNDSPTQYTGECLSLRTEAPYEATHLTWHMTEKDLAGQEHRNYCKSILPNSTHWSK